MKLKIYTLILSFFIFSCSSNSDDNNDNNDGSDNNNTNALLVSKITYNDSESSDYSYEENFTYDENKIVEILKTSHYNGLASSSLKTSFVYANDLILRADSYDSNDNLLGINSFEYDPQGRLTVVENCYYFNGNCSQTITSSISYNSNGTVVIRESNANEENETTFQLDNQGNIVGVQEGDGDCENTISLDYDNNNAPFKNIIGDSSLFAFYGLFSDAPIIGFCNNALSYQLNSVCDNSSDILSNTISLSYDYNQEGYPRNIVATDSGGYTTTILLEYN